MHSRFISMSIDIAILSTGNQLNDPCEVLQSIWEHLCVVVLTVQGWHPNLQWLPKSHPQLPLQSNPQRWRRLNLNVLFHRQQQLYQFFELNLLCFTCISASPQKMRPILLGRVLLNWICYKCCWILPYASIRYCQRQVVHCEVWIPCPLNLPWLRTSKGKRTKKLR